MAEGKWQCGMCAASNEPSTHVCVVCDTFRSLGARGGTGTATAGDLLAPSDAQEAFRAPREPVPDTRQDEEAPSVPVGGPSGHEGAGPPTGEPPKPSLGPGPIPRGREEEPSSTEPLPRVGPEYGVVKEGLWRLPRLLPGTWRALALAGLAVLVLVGAWWWPSGDDSAEEAAESAAPPMCPEPIAELIPGGEEGVLVESYRTERHQIVLCSDGMGQLHYFGELLDGSGEEMVVPAERTEDGYRARAGGTVYEIVGGLVVIETEGEELARYDLEEAPPPR